jgi:hypothetical protein
MNCPYNDFVRALSRPGGRAFYETIDYRLFASSSNLKGKDFFPFPRIILPFPRNHSPARRPLAPRKIPTRKIRLLTLSSDSIYFPAIESGIQRKLLAAAAPVTWKGILWNKVWGI